MAPIPSPLSRLIKLSENISRNSKLLSSYLVEKRLPQPSFAASAPPDGITIPHDEPTRKKLDQARRELASATKELHDLSVGPREGVRELAWSFNSQLSLHFIYRFHIAKAFPVDETISFAELADRTKTPLHDLKRLVRHAITNRIFAEPTKNVIAHTAASRLLAEDPDIQAWTGMTLEEFWPGAVRACDAMEKWKGSQEPKHTGLSVHLGEEKHLWEVVTSSSTRAKRFGTAMKGFSTGEGYEINHLVSNYPWSQFADPTSNPNPTIVDVGGSLGFAAAAIAQSHPSLQFVVQDLAKVYADTDPKAKLPAEVRDRIRFMAHDFFEPQPVKDADVYLIRWCMHNWSDKYAIKILRALIPGLKKGARVVINDGVLPEPKAPTASWHGPTSEAAEAEVAKAERANEEVDADYMADRSMRSLDLIMLQALNARERDVDEWKELFKEADERFIWRGAWRSGRMWILEAEWSG